MAIHLPKPPPANVQYAAWLHQTGASVSLAPPPGPGLAIRVLRAWCASNSATADAYVESASGSIPVIACQEAGSNSIDYGDYGAVMPTNTGVVLASGGSSINNSGGVLYDVISVTDE